MNEVEVIGRKCEPSIQVVDLQSVTLATALPRPRVPTVRGNDCDESHRRDGSCGDLRRAWVITSQRPVGDVERKEMVHSPGATNY